jgi:predicted O-linked N-acetylglucosamine transferase (SPINDLY family)
MDQEALLDLAWQYVGSGRWSDVSALCRQILESDPDCADIPHVLGIGTVGDAPETVALVRACLAIAPAEGYFYHVLGVALLELGREGEAAVCFEKAVAIDPAPETFYRLGTLRQKGGRSNEAIAAYRKALEKDAAHAAALEALCLLLQGLGRADEAIPYLDRATAPQTDPEWLVQYQAAWERFDAGEVEEALALFRQAAAGPCPRPPETSIATIIPGSPQNDNEAILKVRRAWAERYLPRRMAQGRSGRRPRSDADLLRIGYVSSFFHCDNWMKPVWGLINSHDRCHFEIHLFSESPAWAIRHGYNRHAQDRFHEIGGISTAAAAACVAQACIDVLVDLNGYSGVQTLPLFALRPAPVVVSWFGMYATSGMTCYDCLIGDCEVIPEEEEKFYCEKIIRVPVSYLTFQVAYPVPPVASPPCLTRRRFTFGCLAPQYKITHEVVAAWSRILEQAPESSLLLKNIALASSAVREQVHRLFEVHGIGAGRIRLEGPANHFQFLQAYDTLDLALDTFPYSGATTTSEAIWQGVPVVTFHGDRWVSRTSASILCAANLNQFIGQSLDEYVTIAVRLANSPGQWKDLGELRQSMRSRLLASPVCDTRSFARNMERIYMELAAGQARAG